MATIKFALSARQDKDRNNATNAKEIRMRFMHGKTDQQARTNIFVQPQHWDAETQRIVMPNMRQLNDKQREQAKYLIAATERLATLAAHIQRLFLDVDKAEVPKNWLKDAVDRFNFPKKYAPKPKSEEFFDAFQEFFERNKDISAARIGHFETVEDVLRRFLIYKRRIKGEHTFELSFEALTDEIMHEICTFIREEYKILEDKRYRFIFPRLRRRPRPRGQSTTNLWLSVLRTFIIWAVKMKKTQNNPFKTYQIGETTYGTPYYISIDERNQIYRLDLRYNEDFEEARDIFVFQCLIGCRHSDLIALKKENVINNEVSYVPRKTKDGRPYTVTVPLNRTAQEILLKYKRYPGEFLLPVPPMSRYNDLIKTIFTRAGVVRKVTVLDPVTREGKVVAINTVAASHIARRTFVGNLYKQVKDPELVGSMSGHRSGSVSFGRYRTVDSEMKRELVDKLE